MSLEVFLAVLGAAFLHAFWNALIKTGTSRQSSMLLLTLGHAAVGACVAATKPFPMAEAWPWLIGSGLIHMTYQLFLAYAYEHGDLSRVYPIARGAAPMIVTVVGAIFLADQMGPNDYLGVIVLGLGIAIMARGVFASGESRRMLPYAFGSACATAGYSMADGLGARVLGDAVAYVAWLMMLSALFYTPAALALRGTVLLRVPLRAWGIGAIAAGASFGAYAIAVWAMTLAPIALVAALRETSILFAILIGWLVFGEKMDRTKALAATVIVAGVLLTRL
ncbi:EamA family transporter [Thioclava sp. FR2]|uniref:EamA family transporter n=1 Tax=Thioclava sp. FR2 TaxID=3445780 RepID=UPI003EBD14B5